MKKTFLFFGLLIISLHSKATYEDHFPTYFEYCGGSQWQLQTGEKGGPAGHGFIYINGLCKDYTSDYPQVVPCNEVSSDLQKKYPHSGVGISLDKTFSNVMWVAVPGRDLILFGDSEPRSMSYSDMKEHIKKINELKIFNSVVSNSDFVTKHKFGSHEYLEAIAEDTLGTDHAVNWARELHCVKIPTPASKLKSVAKYLNDSNNQYKSGASYKWKMNSNNCIHLSVNAGYAMDINSSVKTDQKFLAALMNMAIPSNTFMMYMDMAVLGDIPSSKELWMNLFKTEFNPAQVGALMSHYPAFPSGEKFNTDGLEGMALPRFNKPLKLLTDSESYRKKYMKPEYTDLKINAQMWIKKYEKALSKASPVYQKGFVGKYLQEQLELAQKIEATEN